MPVRIHGRIKIVAIYATQDIHFEKFLEKFQNILLSCLYQKVVIQDIITEIKIKRKPYKTINFHKWS